MISFGLRLVYFLPFCLGFGIFSNTSQADRFLSEEFSKAVAAERKGDYSRAHYTYSILAGQGDPQAQHALGRLYEHGRGVQGNAQTALQWYRRAADQGHPDSEYRLAIAYSYGLGGYPQDNREAVIWLKRAAEHGHGKARKMLARAYEQGRFGLPVDPKQARYWQKHPKSKKNE
jgi:TPR repeat protein